MIAIAPDTLFDIVRIEHDGAESTIFANYDHQHAIAMLERLQASYSYVPGYVVTLTPTTLILDYPIPGIDPTKTTAVYTIREVTP